MKRAAGKNQRARQKRFSLRSLRILEIGAGGSAVGQEAGFFTCNLGSEARFRRTLLRYANRRPMRRGGPAFRSISLMATDRERNPANDFRMNAESLPLRSGSIEIICLNFTLDGVTLAPRTRKPFDLLAEGLISKDTRGDKIRTCDLLVPNQAL